MGRITISNAVLFLVLLAARAAAAWPTVGRIAMTKRSPPAAAATASKLDPLLFGTVAKRSPSVEVGAGAARHSGFDVRLPSLTTLGSTHGEALKTRYKLKLAEAGVENLPGAAKKPVVKKAKVADMNDACAIRKWSRVFRSPFLQR